MYFISKRIRIFESDDIINIGIKSLEYENMERRTKFMDEYKDTVVEKADKEIENLCVNSVELIH